MLAEDVWLLGQRQRTLLLMARQATWLLCLLLVLLPPSPMGACRATRWMCHNWGTPSIGNPNLLSKPAWHLACRETSLLYWIVTCPPLWRETLPLSSKAVHYHYINILEKIVQNKDSQCFCLQDILQKHHKPLENCIPTMFFLWILSKTIQMFDSYFY